MLQSLAGLHIPPDLSWEVIVVDNNSTDGTPDAVATVCQESAFTVQYVFERQQGLSHARNKGIQIARGDVLAFTDDDVTVDASWLVELRAAFEKYGCTAVGGKVVPLWSAPRPRWFYDEPPFSLRGAIAQFDLGDHSCETRTAPFGANMAFARKAFDKYGVFRSDLGRTKEILLSGEETELFHRLISAGERVAYTPLAVVYHPVGIERTRKRYFQSWFFHFGRGQIRTSGIAQGVICYFGIPRYLLREAVDVALGWLVATDPKRRFRRRVQLFHIAGMMVESRNEKPADRRVRGGVSAE